MAQAINGKAQQKRSGTRRAVSRPAEDFVAKSEKHPYSMLQYKCKDKAGQQPEHLTG